MVGISSEIEKAKWNIPADFMGSIMIPYGVTIQLNMSNDFQEIYDGHRPLTVVG